MLRSLAVLLSPADFGGDLARALAKFDKTGDSQELQEWFESREMAWKGLAILSVEEAVVQEAGSLMAKNLTSANAARARLATPAEMVVYMQQAAAAVEAIIKPEDET